MNKKNGDEQRSSILLTYKFFLFHPFWTFKIIFPKNNSSQGYPHIKGKAHPKKQMNKEDKMTMTDSNNDELVILNQFLTLIKIILTLDIISFIFLIYFYKILFI